MGAEGQAVTTTISFHVLKVECRNCSAQIPIDIPNAATLSPQEILRECERQAEEKHVCPNRTTDRPVDPEAFALDEAEDPAHNPVEPTS